MVFKAMGLISGMFYTTRNDSLGWFLSRSNYGNDERSWAIAEYTNPEHPEIIYNIPPCYLITSKADMLERYTLDFAGELGNKGVEHYLRHMGSDPKLIHAFPVIRPDLQESERVIDETVGWFQKHVGATTTAGEIGMLGKTLTLKKTADSNRHLSVRTCDIQRCLPGWAKIVKTVNGVSIYNFNIFENIMSWNKNNLDTPALDYYGTVITYRDLPDKVNDYVCGLRAVGVKEKSVVTLCMPVSIENMLFLLALNCIGAIANNVNYLFLKSDFDLYTRQKDSDTVIILDAFLPEIVESLENSQIKNVIITSLLDYLPEDNRHVFDDLSTLPEKLREIFDNPGKKEDCIQKMQRIKDVRFIPLRQMLQMGAQSIVPLFRGPVDIERDISYSYTSGTTGPPKCIVFKESSANALIEMHAGLYLKDYVGERVFQIIPLTHATGERISGYLQMAKGKTLVPIPIYNKESFGIDVMRSQCNWIVAAPSFYLAAVAKGIISKNAWQHVTRPSSGGEPVTKANVALIDQWLHDNGCNARFAIGGGAAEDGSGTIFTYFMDEETKTNETGYPLEPFIRARIVDETGISVPEGQRGYLEISSPAAADRYLNDPDASARRWYYDENGIRWGVTGDIAVQNADGSYNILGRASDSYVNCENQSIYLFDIEYSLDINDPIIEWEITAHDTNEGSFVVGQAVLKMSSHMALDEVVELLCGKYHLDAVKFYEKFENSDVTGKRDILKLKADKEGYYAPCDNNHLYQISYANGKVRRQVISKVFLSGYNRALYTGFCRGLKE